VSGDHFLGGQLNNLAGVFWRMRMREGTRKQIVAKLAGALCALGAVTSSHAATTYFGNGASGFGGTLGEGSLTLSDGAGLLTATFNPSGGFTGNDVVVYIDTGAGGFTDTSAFSDDGDGGRQSISANSGSTRCLISFPAGFNADYALEFENNTYIGLFGLASGGNNSLNYITGTGPANGGPYTVSFPLSDLGVIQGQSFNFVADLISTSGYGSNETIGSSSVTPDVGAAPNAGFDGSIAFTGAPNTYATSSVPEPTSMLSVAAAGLLLLRRRPLVR
jgi:hypothetical protein